MFGFLVRFIRRKIWQMNHRWYLKSPEWQAFTRKYKAEHPYCEMPGCTNPTDHTHHKRYYAYDYRLKKMVDIRFRERDFLGCVMAVCAYHHAQIHGYRR